MKKLPKLRFSSYHGEIVPVLHQSKPVQQPHRPAGAPACDADPIGSNQVFADAARVVFQTMLNTELYVQDYQASTHIRGRGLAVLIALNGTNAGTLIVCMSQSAASRFVATLTGLEPAEISSSVMVDGVCELVNMIAGAAKAQLDDTDMRFEMTLPVSFLSEEVAMEVKAGMPGGVLECRWANETFQLGVWRVKEG